MDVLVIHLINALLYASVLFLIAGGLSLIYGVMRIVNLAHGNLYAFGAYVTAWAIGSVGAGAPMTLLLVLLPAGALAAAVLGAVRSEEHTSELQSRLHLVCRLLLEKKKNNI